MVAWRRERGREKKTVWIVSCNGLAGSETIPLQIPFAKGRTNLSDIFQKKCQELFYDFVRPISNEVCQELFYES